MKFGPTPQNTWDVTPAEVSLIRPVLLPRPASIPALVHRLYGFTATSGNEPSLHSHWQSLKDGVRTMADHPQGYGLGNVGQTASRTGTPLKAGESNYTELGVELGVLGALLWLAWCLALLGALLRAGREDRVAAGFAAAFAAVLALAVQTDVIGVPWLACCLWLLAGSEADIVAQSTISRPRPLPATST